MDAKESKPNGQGASPAAEEPQMRALASALVDRLVLARMLGMTHEGKRDVYGVLGYDNIITAQQYRERYARGGIAGRVVDALAKAVWRGDGDIFEDEDPEKVTQFETEWDDLNAQHDVWSTLRRTHIRASLGSFATLMLGAYGNWSTELPRGKPGDILYLQPYGGGIVDAMKQRGTASGAGADVVVDQWDEDTGSKRFGQPLTYRIKHVSVSAPNQEKPVHWSRMIHVPAIGFLEDAVFGPPALEDVWNYLLDLDKVVGGGSEAFWLRANAGTHINIDKKLGTPGNSPLPSAAELTHMQEEADKYAHQMTRMIRTRGVEINTLGSEVADFKSNADALVTLIAGTKGIPKRILTGSEMGQLASEQDRDNWNDQVKDCRTGYALPVVLRPFVTRLIDYGYLSKPKQWTPMWPDEASMSEPEKLAAAESMAKLNDHGVIVVTSAEVREFLGYAPLDDEQIEEELKVRGATTVADEDPDEEVDPDEEDDPDAEDDPEEDAIDRVAAALSKGGTVNITVKG